VSLGDGNHFPQDRRVLMHVFVTVEVRGLQAVVACPSGLGSEFLGNRLSHIPFEKSVLKKCTHAVPEIPLFIDDRLHPLSASQRSSFREVEVQADG
jgi:hypothetical protein